MAPRRPLGAGIVSLIVLDVVLVAVFVMMLVQLGPAGDGDKGGGEASDASPSTSGPEVEPVVFASPTRNIACRIEGAAARCEIAHVMYEKPALEGCSGDVGHEIEVTAEGARWVCRTASPPAPPGEEISNLDWGDSVSAYGFTCTSENDGVTCVHDGSGHSFSLARRVYDLA